MMSVNMPRMCWLAGPLAGAATIVSDIGAASLVPRSAHRPSTRPRPAESNHQLEHGDGDPPDATAGPRVGPARVRHRCRESGATIGAAGRGPRHELNPDEGDHRLDLARCEIHGIAITETAAS